MSKLMTVEETKALIAKGGPLALAGDEALLKQLPKGNWIAGSIPYFMAEQGGIITQEKIDVTVLPDSVASATVKVYTDDTLPQVYKDIPEHGFGIIIIPAFSSTHLAFALNAPNYAGFPTRPLLGWISGIHLKDLGKVTPKIMDGTTGKLSETGAVVLLCSLPKGKAADVSIINIFRQGSGDTITFPSDGFSVTDCYVNGEKKNFAAYVTEKKLDTQLPMVADYNGAMINVSFQNVDAEKGKVDFYAPVFGGVRYRYAAPFDNYVKEFTARIPNDDPGQVAFSCNCICNFLYSELEGKKTGHFTGPITFGEIAYQLVNQTLSYLTINDVK